MALVIYSGCQNQQKHNVDEKKGQPPAQHITFNGFWEDFKEAVQTNDKRRVIALTYFPFYDMYNIAYDPDHALSCKNPDEMLEKFKDLFNKEVRKAIANDSYRGYDSLNEDVIQNGDYLLTTKNRYPDLLFTRINGIYKLNGIVYYPFEE